MKVSQYPRNSSPATSDYLLGNQASGPTTQRFLLSDLITLFWTLANVPNGGTSPITRDSETNFDFVASGGVWSADSAGVNRNASMTAMVVYINGRRISISAVTARTFTASKDTYIDVLDNLDGTGTLVYTETTNNAASVALAANSIRIGIIITGASTIAASTSINQGQETRILPIASSIPYQVSDSLGNLICCRDPGHRTLSQRILTSNVSTTSTSAADLTGANFTVNVPTARKIKLSVNIPESFNTGGGINKADIYDVTAAATVVETNQNPGNTLAQNFYFESGAITPPASGVRNYKIRFWVNSGTFNTGAAATPYLNFRAELA